MIPDLGHFFWCVSWQKPPQQAQRVTAASLLHHEYSEAAVSRDSGGKNSKVIEANPNMKPDLHVSVSETLISAQITHPPTRGPHERRVLGNSSESGICSIHQHAHVFLYDVL